MIEVIVALAIMVMMAGMITPSLIGYLEQQRVERAVAVLIELEDAVTAYRSDVGAFPRNLSYFTTDLAAGSLDSCGGALSNGERNNWDGPYMQRLISTSGFPMFVGTAQDQLVRTGGASGTLEIRIPVARLEDAMGLDAVVDPSDGAASGFVQWTSNATTGSVQIEFVYPINGC